MARAFHFGESARPLCGVYHAPETRPTGRAALLLNPFGEEAIRAFRIYRLIAERLARSGVATLRFDYAATGDSAGDCSEVSLDAFVESTLQAHDELLDISGATAATWIGLRLGASIGLCAAARAERLSGLILWDPVQRGADYLTELVAGHDATLKALLGATPPQRTPPREALGFEIPSRLADDLSELDLSRIAPPRAAHARLVGGPDDERLSALASRLRVGGVAVDLVEDPESATWNSDRALNSYVVPIRTVSAIVEAASGVT